MTVCVIGLGYIGLPTAAILATKGHTVCGVDIDRDLVGTINQGGFHSQEPDLDVLVRSAVQSGNLVVQETPMPADVFIIAVPTPIGDNRQPDLSAVDVAAAALAPHLVPGNLVILESTSPVGATERVGEHLKQIRTELQIAPAEDGGGKGPSEPVYLAHCPERVLPGEILQELVGVDRVVGGVDSASTERACAFYANFVQGRILTTDARTAELVKLAENAYRDVNIAYANELSLVCDRLDIDVMTLIELANHHPRVDILRPGPGVGGHCIAVDPWFIVASVPDATRLIPTARQVNDAKPGFVVSRIEAAASKFDQPVIVCLGLAFKADVDDLRGSPSVEIVRRLAANSDCRILAVEPHIAKLPPLLENFVNVDLVSLPAAIEQADLVVSLVNHREFDMIVQADLAGKVLVDTLGIWRGLLGPAR